MWHKFLPFLFLPFLFVLNADAICQCTHHASPTGTGTGTLTNPMSVSAFWGVAQPGDTLCLLNGTYQGAANMLTPTGALAGTSAQPITVKALSDGQVTIDGQGVRQPVHLIDDDWLVLEGMNFANGNLFNVQVFRSDDNVFRRVVMWDADANSNNAIVQVSTSFRNTFEDCAAFGTARKMLTTSQEGNFTTFRRCWAQFRHTTATSPHVGVSTGYVNDHAIAENIIANWDAPLGSVNPFGMFRTGGDNDDSQVFATVLASIGYVRAGDAYQPGQVILVNKADNVIYRDMVVYIEGHASTKRWSMADLTAGVSTNLEATRFTGIGGAAGTFSPEWTTTDIVEGATLGAIYGAGESIFVPGSAGGAKICFETVNATLTATPLWPWRMDQRIKDARVASGYASVTAGMANDSGLLTDAISQMFGAIPAACTRT